MTEAEWETCADPDQMLGQLRRKDLTERKFRLFAVACARRVWVLLKDPGREAAEVAERYADGDANKKELRAAQLAAIRHTLEDDEVTDLGEYRANQALFAAINAAGERQNLKYAAESAADAVADAAEERAAQCLIFRDIIASPFRIADLPKNWRTGTVLTLARQMYESRDFGAMPILADALQDAGCDDVKILDHCRGPGPHVRGCWVVDLILGKE